MTQRTAQKRLAPLASLFLCLGALACGVSGELDGGLNPDAVADTDALKACLPSQGGIKGVDVSIYQGTIDWHAVRSASRQFGIARVSDGLRHVDSSFERNWSGIRSAGMVRGAYQFFRPGQDAAAQADLMIRKVGRLGVGDLPAVIDVEVTDGISSATLLAGVRTWIDRVRAGTGKTPLLYTSPGFWAGIRNASSVRGAADLWVAHWFATCPTMPLGFTNFRIWQLSDRAQVSGIKGRVDGDRFNGSLNELYGYAGGRPSTALRAPDTGPELVSSATEVEESEALATLGLRGSAMGEAAVRGEATLGAEDGSSQGATLGHPPASDLEP